MTRGTRGVLAAACALSLLLHGCGEAAGTAPSPAATGAQASAAPPPAGALRVGGLPASKRLVDADRRTVHLRGASVNALVDYGAAASAPIAFSDADAQQMAALGFNAMRLAVSWSKVMPRPGKLDERELRRITAAVGAASSQGIHTVVSLHSDRYAAGLGTGTEFDGAPRWAVRTGGRACGDPRPRYYTPCAAAAAAAFYANTPVAGRPLQQWYTRYALAVSRAARAGGGGYVGLDLLNEPTDPSATPDHRPSDRWRRQLGALQRRLVLALRRAGDAAPLWIQPQGPRSTRAERDPVLPRLSDRQLVYAPHAYVDVYDAQPSQGTRARLLRQYRAFAAEARPLGAALVIGEFPGAAGGVWDELRREHLDRQDANRAGGFSWLWKQPASGYGWAAVNPDGGPRPGTDAMLELGRPRLVAGDGAVVRAAGDQITVQATGDDPATVDVWLGVQMAAAGDPLPEPQPIGAATASSQLLARPETVAAGVRYGGTLVRLSLDPDAAPQRWTVPGGR